MDQQRLETTINGLILDNQVFEFTLKCLIKKFALSYDDIASELENAALADPEGMLRNPIARDAIIVRIQELFNS